MLKPTANGGVTVDVERTAAMLALTAIHDVMKARLRIYRMCIKRGTTT